MKLSFNDLNTSFSDPKIDVMNFLNEIANKFPNAISFAPGRPLEKLFEVENSLDYLKDYLEYRNVNNSRSDYENYNSIGQYGPTKGIINDILKILVKKDFDIDANSTDFIVTTGCQEAMFLCLICLCSQPNDIVFISDPAYIGFSGAAKILGIDIVPIPNDELGINLDALVDCYKSAISKNRIPRLLYIAPDYANPTGLTMSDKRRKDLIKITKELNILIVEDHAYNYFSYSEKKLYPLRSFKSNENIIYIGSFSKSIYPSLRLGFIITSQEVISPNGKKIKLADEFSKAKSFLTVNTSQLSQAIVGGIIVRNNFSLKNYTTQKFNILKKNRNIMLAMLDYFFPRDELWCKDISWNEPDGGFFINIKLPFNILESDIETSANLFNVIWTPMSYFYLEKNISSEIRLSFSYVTEEEIKNGIRFLSDFIKHKLSTN